MDRLKEWWSNAPTKKRVLAVFVLFVVLGLLANAASAQEVSQGHYEPMDFEVDRVEDDGNLIFFFVDPESHNVCMGAVEMQAYAEQKFDMAAQMDASPRHALIFLELGEEDYGEIFIADKLAGEACLFAIVQSSPGDAA